MIKKCLYLIIPIFLLILGVIYFTSSKSLHTPINENEVGKQPDIRKLLDEASKE